MLKDKNKEESWTPRAGWDIKNLRRNL